MPKHYPAGAKLFIGCIYFVGASALAASVTQWESRDLTRFACYFLIAVLASGLKVNLPSITGTMSVNFLFILIGIVELHLSETVVLACTATLIQSLWHGQRRARSEQVLFNVASMAIAVVLSSVVYQAEPLKNRNFEDSLRLVLAASAFFLAHTLPVSMAIALTEQKPFRHIWKECYFWSFPYYLIGAAVAGLFHAANRIVSWYVSLLVLPVVYLIYRSYRLYLNRLDDEKRHAEEMASLHLRTIEALALAIEAKDHSTHDHLQRVQVYAMEIARELGLTSQQMEALRAAAVLHDIGKLAVPEHIISKPGRLTAEEFEKIKIHPVVGAEILEQVQFPYPVAPIVRAHHEKYDGTGYPDGLKGEDIPVGARILSAVDCLDALASDRQYRRALPLDEAMAVVVRESGKSFDPRVVDVLSRRHVELEKMAVARQMEKSHLSSRVMVAQPENGSGAAEAGGGIPVTVTDSRDFLTSIAAARQEVQALFELAQDLGNSLSLDETLSVLAVRLRRMVPYDSMAIFVVRDGRLIPEYVSGENSRLLYSLEIPVGHGLVGWVAETRQPILNGNPSVEPGYSRDASRFAPLRSATAVPLEGVHSVVGVLALYSSEKDAFTKDHLRVLLAINAKLSMSVENALKYRQAETSATTDYLTGLPNARSLFLHLDAEVSRCRRLRAPLAVLVCDLDGFKQVNDVCGHLEGNKVLKHIARGLRESCREYDYVARMGGDEFVVVLPGAKPDDVPGKIAQLHNMVSLVAHGICGPVPLSVSIGDAHFPEDGQDAEALLSEADRRMYAAKQDRRSRLPNLESREASVQ